ncbi:MAG: hypothetical protein ACI9AD_000110 [Nitriliruptoraceae bacterium]|jgi:hypothetical protein
MNNTHAATPPTSDPSVRSTVRPFHTPVRGHTFAIRPRGGAELDRSPLVLRTEPDNPADPHAVAVWADGGGTPWRVGYLERAVAVRLAGRVDDEGPLRARFAGWLEEPDGRWLRPLVRVGESTDAATTTEDELPSTGLRALPPYARRRRAA